MNEFNNMLQSFAYFQILGQPIAIWFGVLAFIFFLTTALVGYLNYKGKTAIPFKWHPRLALISIILVIIHIILVVYLIIEVIATYRKNILS